MKFKKIPTSIKVIMASVLIAILTLGIIKANSVFAEPELEDLVKEREYGALQFEDKFDWESNSIEAFDVIGQISNTEVFVQLETWKDRDGDKKITLYDVLYGHEEENTIENAEYLAENVWSTVGEGTVFDYGSDEYYMISLTDANRWNNVVCVEVTPGLNDTSGSIFKESDYWFDAEHSCLYLKKELLDSAEKGIRCQTTYVCKDLKDVSKNMPIVVTFDEKLTDSKKAAAEKALKTDSVEIKSMVFNDNLVKFDIINDKNTILFNKDCFSIYVNGYYEAEFDFDELTGEIQLNSDVKLSDIFFVEIKVKDVNEISAADKRMYEKQTQTAQAKDFSTGNTIDWSGLPGSGITLQYAEGKTPQVGDRKFMEFVADCGYNSKYSMSFYENNGKPINNAVKNFAWADKAAKWYQGRGMSSNVAFVPFGYFVSGGDNTKRSAGKFTSEAKAFNRQVWANIAILGDTSKTPAEKESARVFFRDNMKKMTKTTKVEHWYDVYPSLGVGDSGYGYIAEVVGLKAIDKAKLLPNATVSNNGLPYFMCSCMHICADSNGGNLGYNWKDNNTNSSGVDYKYASDFSAVLLVADVLPDGTNSNTGTLRCMIVPQHAKYKASGTRDAGYDFRQRTMGFANIRYELQNKGQLQVIKKGESSNIAIGKDQTALDACKKNDNYKIADADSTVLANAKFRVYAESEWAKYQNGETAKFTEVKSGDTIDLTQGKYYVLESATPSGYAYGASKVQQVTVKANKCSQCTFTNPKQNLWFRMDVKDLTTESLGSNAKSLDSNEKTLGEVKFTVSTKVGGKTISATAECGTDPNEDGFGILYFNLPCGYEYTITQTDTLENYSLADSVEQSLNEDSGSASYKSSANTIKVTYAKKQGDSSKYVYTVTGKHSSKDYADDTLITVDWDPKNGLNPGRNNNGSYSYHITHWEPRQYVTVRSQVQDTNRGAETPAVVKSGKSVAKFTIAENATDENRYNATPVTSVNSEYVLYYNGKKVEIASVYDDLGELNSGHGTCVSKQLGDYRYISAEKIKVNGNAVYLPSGSYEWKVYDLETYNPEDPTGNKACEVQTIGAKYKLLTNSSIFLGYNSSGKKVTVGSGQRLEVVGVEENTSDGATVVYGKTASYTPTGGQKINGLCESTEVSGKAYISAVIVKYNGNKYRIPNGKYQWELQEASKGYYLNESKKTTSIENTGWSTNANIKKLEVRESTKTPVKEERQSAKFTVFTKGYDRHTEDLENFSDTNLSNEMKGLKFGKTAQGKIMKGDVSYYNSGNNIQVTSIKAIQNGSSETCNSFEVDPNVPLSNAVFAIFNTSDIVTMDGEILPGHSEDEIINMFTNIRLGDTNMDDDVDIMDVTNIQRHIYGIIKFSPYQEIIADTNGDKVIDLNDVKMIQYFAADFTVEGVNEEQQLEVGVREGIVPIGYYLSNGKTGTTISKLGSSQFTYEGNLDAEQTFSAIKYSDNADFNKLPLGSYLLVEILEPKDDDPTLENAREYKIESWFEKQEITTPWKASNQACTNAGDKTLAFYAPLIDPNNPEIPIAPDPVWPTEPTPNNPDDPDNPYIPHDPDDPYDPDNPDKPDNPDDSDDIPPADPEWVNKHYNDKSYRIVDEDNKVDGQYLVQDMLPAEFAFVVNEYAESSRITDYYMFFYYEITKEEYDKQHNSGKEFEYMEYDGMYFRRFEFSDNQNIEGGANSVGARSLTNTIVLNELSKGFKGYNLVSPNKTVGGAIKDVKWLNEKLTNPYYKGEYHIAVGLLTSSKRATGGTIYETRRILMDDVLTIKARQLFKLD